MLLLLFCFFPDLRNPQADLSGRSNLRWDCIMTCFANICESLVATPRTAQNTFHVQSGPNGTPSAKYALNGIVEDAVVWSCRQTRHPFPDTPYMKITNLLGWNSKNICSLPGSGKQGEPQKNKKKKKKKKEGELTLGKQDGP